MDFKNDWKIYGGSILVLLPPITLFESSFNCSTCPIDVSLTVLGFSSFVLGLFLIFSHEKSMFEKNEPEKEVEQNEDEENE